MDGIRARYCFPGDTNADLPADSTLAYLYDPSGNTAQRMELVYDNDPAQAEGLYVQVRDYQVFDAYGALSGRIDTVTYPSVPMDRDPVGFGGQEGYYTDVETGLCLLGARYYDASVGRFLNRDPTGYGGGINLYGFCQNNPVMESDPEGTSNGGAGTDIRVPGLVAVKIMAAQKAAAAKAAARAAEIRDAQVDALQLLYLDSTVNSGSEDGTLGQEAGPDEEFTVTSKVMSKINCFVAGTLVQMADGSSKKIEDVKKGDFVLSRNPETGLTEAKPVLSRSVRAAPQVLTLTLTDSKTHLTQTITCTPGHPFYVQGQGFVLAEGLGIGTSIVTRAGPRLSVLAIKYEPVSAGGVLVYNFTVQDDHTYFVGTLDGGTWVHNDSIKVVPGGAGADLAETAQLHRITNGDESAGNLAVFEYKEVIDGREYRQRMVFSSGGKGKLSEHSEQRAIRYFEKKGMLGSITRVYSERHPCPGVNGCNNLLNQKLPPNVPMYYSVAHGGLGH